MSNNQVNIIQSIIKKDWHFNKNNIYIFALLALFSIYLLTIESKLFYVGLVLLLSVLILIGALLVTTTVVNEYKKKTLVFIMSLPITIMDYTQAKLTFNLVVYCLIWLLLTSSTVIVIYFSNHLPNGLIPYALIIMLELMVAFILILATALITESEIWTIVIMTITNISVSLFMFLIASINDIAKFMEGPIAVWNSMAIQIIILEIISAILIVALIFIFQVRKKDFI